MKIPYPIKVPGETEFCEKCKKPVNTLSVSCGVDFGVVCGHILKIQTKAGLEAVQFTRDVKLAEHWQALACECEGSWRRKYLDHVEATQRKAEKNAEESLNLMAAQFLERDLTTEAKEMAILSFTDDFYPPDRRQGRLVKLSEVKISVEPEHIKFKCS